MKLFYNIYVIMSIKITFELTYLKLKCDIFRFNYYNIVIKNILFNYKIQLITIHININ